MQPTLPLIVGESYSITDWYGMMGFEAVYRGTAEDTVSHTVRDLLVFERVDHQAGFHPFSGVKPEASVGHNYKTGDTLIYVNLRAHYYGDSVETLRQVNQPSGPPKFSLKKR